MICAREIELVLYSALPDTRYSQDGSESWLILSIETTGERMEIDEGLSSSDLEREVGWKQLWAVKLRKWRPCTAYRCVRLLLTLHKPLAEGESSRDSRLTWRLALAARKIPTTSSHPVYVATGVTGLAHQRHGGGRRLLAGERQHALRELHLEAH